MHVGRDEPELFWFPFIAQTAPGLLPGDMWQIGVEQYVAMCKSMRKG